MVLTGLLLRIFTRLQILINECPDHIAVAKGMGILLHVIYYVLDSKTGSGSKV